MWELDLSYPGEIVAADVYEHGNFSFSLRRGKFLE